MGNAVHLSGNVTEYVPEGNGMVFLGKTIPQEILCHIFSYVPGKDLRRSVTRVCKHWHELLSDYHFWFKKLNVEGIKLSEDVRLRLMNDDDEEKVLQTLKLLGSCQVPFNQNLIKNPSGKDKLKHWNVTHGGDGVVVETNPEGSDPIPEESGLPTQHCFVTSYYPCKREQVVDLHKSGFTPFIMNTLKPKVVISEWVSARWDCRSTSQLFIELIGATQQQTISLKWTSDDENVLPRNWYKLERVVSTYPEGLKQIRFTSTGKDLQFWAGHFGAKSAGSSVKLVLV